MTPAEIKELLEDQLGLLKRHSIRMEPGIPEDSHDLCNLTEQMLSVSAFIIDTWDNDKKMYPNKKPPLLEQERRVGTDIATFGKATAEGFQVGLAAMCDKQGETFR